jgi:hypothetical protein
MANDISDGSLSWQARIDTSELYKDIQSIAALFATIGDVNIDVSKIDGLFKEQAEKEVSFKKDAAQQVMKINQDVVNDAKAKSENLQKFLQDAAKNQNQATAIPAFVDADIIDKAKEAYAKADPVTKKFVDDLVQYQDKLKSLTTYQAQLKDALNSGAISWKEYYAAFTENTKAIADTQVKFQQASIPFIGKDKPVAQPVSNEVITQAKDAYNNADAATKKYLDDVVKLQLQLNNLKKEQGNLNTVFKEGNISQDEYLSQSAQLKAAINGVSTELTGVKNAHTNYVDSLNSEGQATQKNVNILTEYRQLRNKIATDQSKGIFNKEDIDHAVELEHSIRNVNAQLHLESSNTAFVEATTEGVRGLVGGFEALTGVMGLFTDNSEKANELMQKTIGFMGVLNGLEEISKAIAKDSALNNYIRLLLAKSDAVKANSIVQAVNNTITEAGNVAAETQTVITEANTVATESNAVATEALAGATVVQAESAEGAIVAQEGLNIAMEANPAAIILIAITALAVAYESLSSTIESASEIQAEAEKKAADAIGKEQAELEILLATATQESATKEQRQDTLNKAIAKYPEYLHYINLENIYTKQSSDLIEKQIELIRQRALVQAAQDVYADKLKKQAEAQLEVNRIQSEGATFGQNLGAFFTGRFSGFDTKFDNEALVNAMDKLKDATTDANTALNLFDGSAQHLNDTLKGTAGELPNFITKISLFGDKFSGLSLPSQISVTTPFDPAKHDIDKKNAVDAAQNLVDISIKGTQDEISARRNLLQTQHDFEERDARISQDQKTLDYQKYLSDISDLNRESNALSLRQNAEYADALVLQLKNAGKEGSQQYYDAQRKALAANATVEIAQNQFDPGAIKKIKEQLSASYKEVDDEQKLFAINTQKDIISAQLASVQAGSDEEFALKTRLLEQERQAAIIGAKNNAAAIEKINAESEKKKSDLIIQTAQAQSDKLLQIQEDTLRISLAKASQGTQEYVNDVTGINITEAQKSIVDAIANAKKDNPALALQDISPTDIFNENQALAFADKIEGIDKALAQRIRAIWAETNAKNLQSDNDFINSLIDNKNRLIDIQSDISKESNNAIINNQNSTDSQKASAEYNNNQIDINDTLAKLDNVKQQLKESYGEAGVYVGNYIQNVIRDFNKIKDLAKPNSEISHIFDGIKDPAAKQMVQQLLIALHALTIESTKLESQKFDAFIKDISTFGQYISQAGADISTMNQGLGDTISTLGDIITTSANFALQTKAIIQGFKDLKTGVDATGKALHALDYASVILAVISLVVTAISAVVKLFSQAKKTAEESAQKMHDYQVGLITGQIKYNEELLQSKKLQDDLTQGTLDQLNAQIQLNEEKKAGYQTDLNTLTQLLATQGQYVSGEHTEKYGGVLGIGRKTKVVQDFSSLGVTADMTNDQIAAILKEKETLNQLSGDTKIFADEWLQVYQNISDATEQSQQLKEQLTEAFAGTTADDIAKSIVDGLQQGKVAAAQWGEDFNKIISNALLSSITNTLESGAVAKIWQTLQANIGKDGSVTPLSPEEIETLRKQYSDAVNQGNALLQQAEAIFPDLASTLDNSNTLAGAIQGSLTEDTANELAGITRGQYDIIKQTMQIATNSLAVQQMIEANTASALQLFAAHLPMLTAYLPYLKSINDNTVPAQLKRDFGL